MWSLGQWEQYHLGTHLKCNPGSPPQALKSESQGVELSSLLVGVGVGVAGGVGEGWTRPRRDFSFLI